jgi:putative N6-adenine-specific DNA methylase
LNTPKADVPGSKRPTLSLKRERTGTKPFERLDAIRAQKRPLFLPCPAGLEAVLLAELQALNVQGLRAGRAGVHAEGDWTDVMRLNLESRIATRVLVQVAQARIRDEQDILPLARSVAWESWFGPGHRLRVDTSAIRSSVPSLHYANLRVKDGICDRLRDTEGARPDIDTVRPDARVHQFLDAETCTLYLDTSGEALFKRGWRLDKAEAPLRENLAAGLLALAGWTGERPLIDPFCGSGTLPIEAALIALGVAPGIARPLGFERLRPHDDSAWKALKAASRARIKPNLPVPIVGSDRDARAIEHARRNAERAGLAPDAIDWRVGEAQNLDPGARSAGLMIGNPPYGERIGDSEALQTLWPAFASQLKKRFEGWQLALISADRDLPKRLRLQAKRRFPVFNGDLDCRLLCFELVSGRYRAEGGENRGAGTGQAT